MVVINDDDDSPAPTTASRPVDGISLQHNVSAANTSRPVDASFSSHQHNVSAANTSRPVDASFSSRQHNVSAANTSRPVDASFSARQHNVSVANPVEEQLGLFCKQKLNKRLFVGTYLERRYVEQIRAYRDVVEIHKSEFDLKKDLDFLTRQLQSLSPRAWIGITGPKPVGASTGHALWVKLREVSFGQYWFQIKHITFGDREILVHLKAVRPLDIFAADPSESTTQHHQVTSTTPLSTSVAPTPAAPTHRQPDKDWTEAVPTLEEGAEALRNLASHTLRQLVHVTVTLVTVHNVKQVCRFTAALLVAAIAGLVQSVRFTGDFSIKLMHETSTFVRASTPIVLGVIDFLTKMVGGFYILVAMMWRGGGNPQPSNKQFYQPQHYPRPAISSGSPPSPSDGRSDQYPGYR